MLRLSEEETGVDLNLNRYLALIGFACLYYDYTLTLNLELSRFWSPLQWNWGTAVFLLNRYLSLFGHVPVIFGMFKSSADNCGSLESYHQYLAIAVQAIVGAVMIIRIYALYNRSRWILVFLITLAGGVIAFGGWAVSVKNPEASIALTVGTPGCNSALSASEARHLGAAWSGVLVFDACIFGLTLYKTLQIGRTNRRTLVDVLLQDGAMYFGVLGVSTLANVLTFMLGNAITRGIATVLTNALATTCATRLMLNVRDPKVQWISPRPTRNTTATSIPFISTMVGWESQMGIQVYENNEDSGPLADIELIPRDKDQVTFAV